MRLTVALLLLSLLGAASSAPTTEVTEAPAAKVTEVSNAEVTEKAWGAELEKRTVGGIFLCTDVGYNGSCGYKVQPLNTCIVLTAPYDLTISSFGPDQGTRCHLYSTHDCTTGGGPSIFLSYPGSADLRNQNFNDRTRSFQCTST